MKNFRLIITLASLVFSSSFVHGAALYWDGGGTGGASLGGTGNWDQVSPLWYNGLADVPWNNIANSDAVFTGTSGTVTLTTDIVAADIYFTNVVGDMLITNLTGAETLTVPGIVDTGGGDHLIGVPIVNSTTLTKAGNGRLYLPVDSSATLTGTVMINQGSVAVENNNAVGDDTSVTVANGAALILDNTNDLTAFYPTVTISGTGVTNSGALRNLSGVTTFYGQIVLGQNNSMIYVDSGAALVYDGESGPLTDNGNNYNVIINGSGTGNFLMGATSIGGSLIVQGPASCYAYLNSISPTAWMSTYVSTGATFYAENNNSFGTSPATLMTTNMLLDGGTLVSGGTYTMYANDGITATTNGGTLILNSGTWTTCNIYSLGNTAVTLDSIGSMRPGGAAGTTTGTINLGSGTLIKSGTGDCNLGYANPSLEIYSNIVVTGSGSLTFNYDSSGGTTSLGAVPSSLNVSNLTLDGGSLHVGHSTTIGATRGIFVTTNNGTIEDVVSSGGTVTIDSPISGPGSLNFPNGHSGVTSAIILANNNTYAGTTTIGASSAVTVGAGSTSGTLGMGNTANSGTLIFNRTGSYSYGGIISGTGPVIKNATGTVTLTGNNTYSGNTTNNAGTLLVNNPGGSGTGSGAVLVASGATLGGTGAIAGAVTVNSGGTLALGSALLSLNGGLSLAGNVTVQINKSLTPSNGMAVVTGTLANTGTGTVKITSSGPPLVAGDRFQLFSQPVSGGGTLVVSGGGAAWNNNLAVDGSISVVSVAAPGISSISLSGTKLVINATNGAASGTFVLLSSTNLALPLASWTPVVTNSYNSSGNGSITNTVSSTVPQQFYILQDQ